MHFAWPAQYKRHAHDGWQTAGLKAFNNRGQWPECRVEDAAEH